MKLAQKVNKQVPQRWLTFIITRRNKYTCASQKLSQQGGHMYSATPSDSDFIVLNERHKWAHARSPKSCAGG